KETGNAVAVFKKDLPPKKHRPVAAVDQRAIDAKNNDTRSAPDRGSARTFAAPDDSSKKKTNVDVDSTPPAKKPVVSEDVNPPKKKPADKGAKALGADDNTTVD